VAPDPKLHPAWLEPDRLADDCTVRFSRRRGPGGQHRNKVETAVIIEHEPTGISAEASERRSQAANRDVAIFRLRVNLALEFRSEIAAEGTPHPTWQARVQGGRISISDTHDDFPGMLAEALDRIAALGWDVKSAAEGLDCSTSQLVRFLKKAPRAMAIVNRQRVDAGLKPLK